MVIMTTAMHHDPTAAQLAVEVYELEQRRRHQQQQRRSVTLYAIGRMFLATLFLVSAAAKIVDYDATLQAVEAAIPGGSLGLPLAIIVELIGGVLLFIGVEAKRVAVVLIAWLGIVTLLMHHDLSEPLNRTFALANMAFVGALLMIVAHGGGAMSFERILKKAKV